MKIKEVIRHILLIWFVLTPLFWQINLSKGTSEPYDILCMAPYSVIHISVFYILMFISLYFEKVSLLHIVLLTLYHPFILFVNFPYLTFRDVYLHGAAVRNILAHGTFTYKRDPYANYWPLSYILWVQTAIFLTNDLVFVNYLLYLVLILALALVTYSFARELQGRGYELAQVSALLFLGLLGQFEMKHYARTQYSLILVFYILFYFLRFKDQRGNLINLLIFFSLVTAHPHQSLYIVIFLVFYAVLCLILHKSILKETAILAGIAFLSWWLFRAEPSLERAYRWITSAFSYSYWEGIIGVMSPSDLPLWGIILKRYYEFSLILFLLIAFIASVSLIKESKEKPFILSSTLTILISVFIATIIFSFILSFMPAWSIMRAVTFLALPASFSSLICFNKFIKTKQIRALVSGKLIGIFLLAFIISLSFTSTTLRFENNISLGEAIHSSEISFLSFLYTHSPHPSNVVSFFRTGFYYYYFDYNSIDHVELLAGRSMYEYILERYGGNITTSQFLSLATKVIEQSYLMLRGPRDEIDLREKYKFDEGHHIVLKRLDDKLTSTGFDNIYSNGYYSIYLNTEKKS